MAAAPRSEGPDGPLRELVAALHELHRAAGKPSVRRISGAIRDRDDLRDTVSHETIGAMLRGTGLPRWVKVECVVRQLSEWAVSPADPDHAVRRFHQLWLAASDVPDDAAGSPPPRPGRDFVVPNARPSPPAERPADGVLGGPTIANLPPGGVHFTGRAALLESIRSALDGQQVSPLALVGVGGVGKTQLAVEYAHRWSAEYDLVWWVPAEQQSPTVASLAALGERLHLPTVVDIRQTVLGVLSALEGSLLRWLLIYDNADLPDDVLPLMPATGGHLLVTSRNAAWADRTPAVRVGAFSRAESIDFLRDRGVQATADISNSLADHLGDLPLALDQVCAMQTATGMPVAEYLRLFAEHLDELLATGRRAGSQTTVTTFVNVAYDRLRAESPAAAQLLLLLAFMAPQPVPLALLRRGREGRIAAPLGRTLFQAGALERIAAQVGRFGLAQVEPDGQRLQVHRLVQLVLREGLDDAAGQGNRRDVHRVLAAADPGAPDDVRTWSLHAEIGPHLIAADAVHAAELPARRAVLHQVRYLERVGDFEASAQLGRAAVDAWRLPPEQGGLGPDHELTLLATRHLANALRALGHYPQSRAMIVATLDRLRRSPQYGEDHPHTLETAAVAAFFLRFTGSYGEALALDSDRVARLRRLYGETDLRTLRAMSNLTINLRLIGDAQRALGIDRELVRTFSGTVGDEDPQTLVSIRDVARDLLDLGRYGEALAAHEQLQHRMPARQREDDRVIATRARAVILRRLGRYDEAMAAATDTYRQCQARFGPDHHLTLAAIMTYANTLRAVGDGIGARSLATEGLDRYRRLFGEQNPLTLAAATNHAVILRTLGHWREAYGVDEVTLDETRRVLGPEHPHTLVAAVGLATDLAHHHNAKEAVSLGRWTLDALTRVRGEDHPETWACALNLAADLRAVNGTGADDLHRQAVARLSTLLGAAHPELRAAGAGGRWECDIEPPPT